MPEPEIELCPECKSVLERHEKTGKKPRIRFHCLKEDCIVSFKEIRGKGKRKEIKIFYCVI